ncbi:MAG: hypothetical protein EHM93_16160 [Bacteroidales bacterium]|nr:MAG: hypothetical protein EHM93_16160 [Bacteroidales bacterium]
MKNVFIILTLISFLGCGNRKNETIKVSDSDFKQAANVFAELNELLIRENGTLWNYKLNGPILLVNQVTRTFIANEQNEKNTFTKQGDFYIGNLPENINIANTAITWENKMWTMVMLPLPESKKERLSLLIHESFHRIQSKVGFDNLSELQNNHLDTKDGRIYLKLELAALKQALITDKPEQHIKNALLFRRYRHQLFPESNISENSIEINEGIAEFTGSILCGMNNEDLQKHYSSMIDITLSNPTLVRSFAYATIPVYGYFMKNTEADWNLKINDKTNLTDLICDFFGFISSQITLDEIKKIGKTYEYVLICKFEDDREQKQIALIKRLKKQFLEDSTLVINLENMNIGYNPGNIMPLDSFGTVYPNLRITDNWGILEVDSCGALVTNWQRVTVSAPEQFSDTLIAGRGWKLKLNNPWKLKKVNGHYIVNK